VPWGIYAKQALEKLGIWAKVEPKLAQADNIRNALTLVSRGEAKFGIVYATDAKADPKVKVASGAKNKPAEEFSTLNQRPYARHGAVILFRSDRRDLTFPQTIRLHFCSVVDLVRSPRRDENRDL
jgi:ABC-type molybdate transport system substrate-binding protein